MFLVRVTGLEPAHRKIPDPKSGASANSAIPANEVRGLAELNPHIPANEVSGLAELNPHIPANEVIGKSEK